MLQTFTLAAAVVFASLLLVFLLALVRRDDTLSTTLYGPIIVAATAATYFVDGQFASRQIIIHGLVAFWGIRLGAHLFLKNSDRGLDWRLAQWKDRGGIPGGRAALGRFFRVVVIQGATSMLQLTPVLLVMASTPAPLRALDWIGVAVWLAGFWIEAAADNELLAWKKVPGNEGHLVTTGLWRFSRHPNYFGEVVAWWGVFLVGLGAPHGAWGIVSPLTVTLLVLFVTGLPMAERKYSAHPEWPAYAARTSAFVPWFPRKGG